MWTETSTKHKAWHSLIKELGLDRVAKLTPCKKKKFGPERVHFATQEEVHDKEYEGVEE